MADKITKISDTELDIEKDPEIMRITKSKIEKDIVNLQITIQAYQEQIVKYQNWLKKF